MEGGTLFDPGFLGTQFIWWIGQVADDSEWRNNSLSGKFEDPNSIPGWGRRYKVRIMGLHDKEEESIPSDQLPWANVMYPITAGGGQANASTTSALRQGNFVFGFFMDGQDQQVPVIMGIMGQNAQTPMSTKIGNTGSNFAATSGYAEGKTPPVGSAKPIAPDEGLVTKKPTNSALGKALAPAPPGVKLNKFGLRPDQPLSAIPDGLQIANAAREQARNEGKSVQEVEDAAMQAVAGHVKKLRTQQESPSTPSQGNPTKENPDAMHQLSSADVKRETKIRECNVIMKPDPDQFVQSAISSIQTIITKLTERLNSYLAAISSYIDAVSSTISSIQKLISDAACEIAKYMKIIFDKIMEYVMKQLNKAMTNAVAALPIHMRTMFADLKEQITELILCLYGKLTADICGQIEGLLSDALDMDNAEAKARRNYENNDTDDLKRKPMVPTCYAEDVIGSILYSNQTQIDDANRNILDNVNEFVKDMQSELAGVSGSISDILSQITDVAGSISGALSFTNISLNIFGCELKPNVAVSDKYCMAHGGSAQPDTNFPSIKSIENSVSNGIDKVLPPPPEAFAPPPAGTADIDLDTPISQQERNAVRQGNIVDEQGNNIGTITSRGST
jgi:hypothetical protein